MRISKSICIAAACLVTTIVALPDFASADDRQPVLCVFDIELKGVRLASMLPLVVIRRNLDIVVGVV